MKKPGQLPHGWNLVLITSRICMLTIVGLLTSNLFAQQANTYSYSTFTGQSLDGMSGSSSLIGAGGDDNPSAIQSIGFNFVYEGNTYTTYSVTPDGFMKLGP